MVVGCCEYTVLCCTHSWMMTDKGLDYVKDSVVEISRAFRRLAESDALQKSK